MSASLLETLTENERQANRSCAIAGLWTAAICLVIVAVGFTGAFYISGKWMLLYLAGMVLPMLAIAGYAKLRDYRGSELKFLMVFGSALIPFCMSIPSAFGFFLMALPIVVSARYLSRKFVWETYAMIVCVTVLTTIPHAAFGLPISTIEKANIAKFSAFLADGSIDRMAYWRGLLIWCVPSHTICLGFFAIILSRLCRDGQEALAHQAKVYARLADVEKGLAIAATMEVMGNMSTPRREDASGTVSGATVTVPAASRREALSQPEVGDWSTTAIVKCISRCKARAATDPEFAALVERDPAAAVREVQG